MVTNEFVIIIALAWRIVYIGQASDASQDQILEEAEMDEIQPGQMKFVFEVRNNTLCKRIRKIFLIQMQREFAVRCDPFNITT